MEFIEALEEAFSRIAANPLHYEDLGRGVRRKLLKRFPYAVFFLFDKGEIWVLAVLQQSQSPYVWRSRP